MGMSFEDLLDYFGRKRKKYIRRVILEESLEPEDGPGIITSNRTTKLKIEQKNYIEKEMNGKRMVRIETRWFLEDFLSEINNKIKRGIKNKNLDKNASVDHKQVTRRSRC